MSKVLISISIILFLFSCGKKGSLEYPIETTYKINNSSLNTYSL